VKTSLCAVVTAALLGLVPSAANAAYAGENGKIAFVRGTSSANDDIYTVDPDGTGVTQLTPLDHLDRGPSWSPSGDRIAFHRLHTNGDAHSDVYTMNADGTTPTDLTPNTGIRDAWPTWSPDGNQIAFVSTRHAPVAGCGGQFEDRHDVYVMGQDGSGPTRLTANRDQESKLSWSPRGDEIALRYQRFTYGAGCDIVSQQSGGYTVSPSTGGTIRATLIDDWSPDGSTYVSSRQELTPMTDIWVGETNVTHTPEVGEVDPAWSPDGRQIVFSTVPFPGDLWIMDADGSNRRPLTATPDVAEYEPDWQPTQRAYARPAAAGPLLVSLVPTFTQCAEPNRTHGPPLAHPSCNPPRPTSSNLVVSAGETRLKSAGFMRLKPIVGAPGGADDSDVRLRMQITNVMNASDLSDYTGVLRPEVTIRLTDRDGFQRQTTQDFPFSFTVPCTVTESTTEGAICNLGTSADALVPGSVPEGSRSIWGVDQVKVYEGDELFAAQGVFVP
jgi:TolB protein